MWLFALAAAVVLLVTFGALRLLWREPRLTTSRERPLANGVRRLDVLAGGLGLALFALVVYAGLAGNPTVQGNLAPTWILVITWVGLVPLSIALGNVWAAVCPWRAVARGVRALVRRAGHGIPPALPYPPWLGRRPAALGVLAFAWLELVAPGGTDPRLLARLAAIYAAVQLVGMALFGIATWSRNADFLSVTFGLFATLASVQRREDRLVARPWLARATEEDAPAGTVAAVCALIGAASYEGLSTTHVWIDDLAPEIHQALVGLGAHGATADELVATLGLIAMAALAALVYRLAMLGARTDEVRAFATTLVPIAAAYALAHGFTLLVFQGQSVIALASDPLGVGSDIFGTAELHPDFTLLSPAVVWYAQVAIVLAGHVTALFLAHERGLRARAQPARQRRLLAAMVTFTVLALALLASGNA